jgi:hypothetical protein
MELTLLAVFSHRSATRLKRLILPTRRCRPFRRTHLVATNGNLAKGAVCSTVTSTLWLLSSA